MRYLWLVIPLALIGCSSVRFVTTDHGRLVTQDGTHVNIVGNPPMVCTTSSGKVYSGYFEYQDDDGTIVLDDFGRGTFYLRDNPKCELRLDTK